MDKIFIGIDPGKQGSVVGITTEGIFFSYKVNVIKNSKGKTEYDVKWMVNILKEYPITGLAIENVHAMPGNGVTAMFSMGQGLGLWEGIIVALGIPYIKVAPQTWQKEILKDFNRGNDCKQASILNAQRMYPNFSFKATERCKVADNNITDALNIALYAKKIFL